MGHNMCEYCTAGTLKGMKLTRQEADILDFVSKMGAFADRQNHRTGDGVWDRDIAAQFGNAISRQTLDSLVACECLICSRVLNSDMLEQLLHYHITQKGALSLYNHK